MPDFDFIAIGIREEEIRLTWAECALAQDCPTSLFHCLNRCFNLRRINQPKAEVRDATDLTDTWCVLVKYQHITTAGGLSLDNPILAIHRNHPKHVLIKAHGTLGIANGECDMR
jgi:hypothetical protein